MSVVVERWLPSTRLWLPLATVIAAVLGGVVIARDPMLAALAFVAGIVGLMILRWPWVGYAILVASVPAQRLIAVPAGGSIITLTQLSIPVAIVALGLRLVVKRSPITWSITLVPFALLVLAMVVSIYDAQDLGAALAETGRWGLAFAAYFMALQFLTGASERRTLLMVGILAAGGIFEAIFGAVQSVLALGPQSFILESGASRAFGTFGKPNSYAGFLEIVLFPVAIFGLILLGRTIQHLREYRIARLEGMVASAPLRHQIVRDALIGATLVVSAGIIVSGIGASLSRGAWLGVAVGALVVGLLYNRLTRLIIAFGVPLTLCLLLAGGAGLLPDALVERVTSEGSNLAIVNPVNVHVTDDNFAAVERLAHWLAGWRMFVSDPLTGVGIGNFNANYSDFYVREMFRISRGHAHNYYIHTLAETGLLGLSAYLTLIGGLWIAAVRGCWRSSDPVTRALLLSAAGMLTAVGVHNVVENLHVLNLGITMGLVWAFVPVAYLRMNGASETALHESSES